MQPIPWVEIFRLAERVIILTENLIALRIVPGKSGPGNSDARPDRDFMDGFVNRDRHHAVMHSTWVCDIPHRDDFIQPPRFQVRQADSLKATSLTLRGGTKINKSIALFGELFIT
jgi:hypothetical protein